MMNTDEPRLNGRRKVDLKPAVYIYAKKEREPIRRRLESNGFPKWWHVTLFSIKCPLFVEGSTRMFNILPFTTIESYPHFGRNQPPPEESLCFFSGLGKRPWRTRPAGSLV